MECTVSGVPIFYEEFGEGRPLLMLHGWAIDHRYMAHHMEPLFADRTGWRRLYPDLPGSGRTPGADWITCQDDMLRFVLEFVDAVAPGEPFAVAGASWGGYLARGVIHERGDRMIGAMPWVQDVELDRSKRNYPAHEVLVHDPAFVAALEANEQDVLRIAVVQSLEYLSTFRATVKAGLADADHGFLEAVGANYAFSFDVDTLSQPFPAPALILAGRQDSLAGYREVWRILENFPRGTLAILDRAGHDLPIEQKLLFRTLAGEWLDRVEEWTISENGGGRPLERPPTDQAAG